MRRNKHQVDDDDDDDDGDYGDYGGGVLFTTTKTAVTGYLQLLPMRLLLLLFVCAPCCLCEVEMFTCECLPLLLVNNSMSGNQNQLFESPAEFV